MLQVSWMILSVGRFTDRDQLSKAFGNEKPDVLHRIELDLWRVLLRVATGQDTVYSAMRNFFSSVPQNELMGLLKEDREFYATGVLDPESLPIHY